MKKIVVSILVIFGATACVEVVDWPYYPSGEDKLIVEAILTDELKHQEIYLSQLRDSINAPVEEVSGAFIEVSSLAESYLFWEHSTQKGRYISSQSFAIVPGRSYQLTIDLEQQKYEAIARGVANQPMRDFPFLSYQETDSLYLGGIGVDYSNIEQAMYELVIDWRHIIPGDTSLAKQVHYVFNSINIGQLFGPEKDQLVFPRQSIVYKRKYALDDGFAEYLRSLVIETQYKGGVFEETNGNLPTNLSNGALGYFAVCSVQRDTLIAE